MTIYLFVGEEDGFSVVSSKRGERFGSFGDYVEIQVRML